MSHIIDGGRTYIVDQQEYAYKTRSLLGLSNSAVVTCDDNRQLGYAGVPALTSLVDTTTRQNGIGDILDALPTDFRMCGIQELTARGVPEDVQIHMLTKFMTQFTKEERAIKIAEYDAIKDNPEQVTYFCEQMVALLSI